MTSTFDDDYGSMKTKVLGGLAVFIVLIVVIGGVIFAAGVSQNKTPATRWGCLYGGGLIEDKGLKRTIAPGTTGGITIFDSMRTVPSDVRDYLVDADQSVRDPGATPIALPVEARDIVVNGETVESVGVTYILMELQAKFVFNENACDWDRSYGRGTDDLNFDAAQGTPSGWTTWLKNNMYKGIQEAGRPVASQFNWLELSTNAEVTYGDTTDQIFDILASEISTELMGYLEQKLGAEYFCGPSYSFDGDVDGEFDCPAIEISITELTPQNPELITNYETIVANAEAQQRIQSDRDRTIAEAEAASDIQQAQSRETSQAQIAQSEAQRDAQIAQAQADAQVLIDTAEANEAAGVAQAEANQAIAEADLLTAQVELEIEETQAQGETAFCRSLEAQGTSCIEYYQAQALREAAANGQYPIFQGVDPTVIVAPEDLGLTMPAPTTTVPAG